MTRALVGNAADEKQIEDATRKQVVEKATSETKWADLSLSRYHRDCLREILEYCGVYQTPYSPIDDRHTNYNIGKSDVGRFILKKLEDARPESLLEIMYENRHQND